MHDIDEYIQAQLILAALNITTHVLEEGGTFVAKIFRGKDISLLYAQLGIFFEKVYCTKPKSSRNSSIEAFVVCKNYKPPKDYKPTMIDPMLDLKYGKMCCVTFTHLVDEKYPRTGPNRFIVPFISCGDLSGFDSDQNYEASEESLEPVAPPTNPPYKEAINLKRKNDKAFDII